MRGRFFGTIALSTIRNSLLCVFRTVDLVAEAEPVAQQPRACGELTAADGSPTIGGRGTGAPLRQLEAGTVCYWH